MSEEKPVVEPAPQVDRRFLVERQGRWFCTYQGLLDFAHQNKIISCETQLIQTPSESNDFTAICFAKVVMPPSGADMRTRTFTGIGDASPSNVGRMIIPHIIRMAETRAKARALRDAVNIGVAALEELGGDVAETGEPDQPHHPPQPHATVPRVQQPIPPTPQPAQQTPTQRPPATPAASGDKATPAQIKAIYAIARDKLHLDEEAINVQSVDLFGAPVGDLTKRQASDLISQMQASK